MPGTHVHRLAIRRGEVEASGTAGPSHYVTYCEDAFEALLRSVGIHIGDQDWELGLKRVIVEWQGSAGRSDVLAIEVGVLRWVGSSVEVGFAGTVDEVPVFEAILTYAGYRPGTRHPMPPPNAVRIALGEGSEA